MKKLKTTYHLSILFLLLILLNGCKDTITGDELDSRIIPPSNVSFSVDIQPVFSVKCANSGCHNGSDLAANLDLTTWAGTTADAGVVFPGEPDNSRLVWSIEGRPGVSPMPPPGFRTLTANQIQGVRTWIKEGAKNN